MRVSKDFFGELMIITKNDKKYRQLQKTQTQQKRLSKNNRQLSKNKRKTRAWLLVVGIYVRCSPYKAQGPIFMLPAAAALQRSQVTWKIPGQSQSPDAQAGPCLARDHPRDHPGR